MLFLLSPAKTLDETTPVPPAIAARATDPLFAEQAQTLIGVLAKKTPAQVAQLMDLSPALAELNVARYRAWQPAPAPERVRPAVWTFDGDVYDGLDAKTLAPEDLDWAQRHLVLLSGLYGALRPLDRMQPYRLEMGTALAVPRAAGRPATKDLYGWWGDTVAAHLNERLAGETAPVVVNLASQEYARAALRPALAARVVECQFEDWKGDRYKIISFFAKRARGTFARWAIRQRIEHPDALDAFAEDGYAFAPEASTPERRVFRRRSDA